MDETRAAARLPHLPHLPELDVEIVQRRLPDGAPLAISLRATPSLEALARQREAQAAFWPWLALNPWLRWQRLLQVAWQPWLPAGERGASAGVAAGPIHRDG